MATPYSDVYNAFLHKITDPDLMQLLQSEAEEMLFYWLMDAQAEFQRICKIDLTDQDAVLEQYNQDLGREEINILAIGMACAWLSPKVLALDNLKNFLNTKDFNISSPANMLRELNALYATYRAEFDSKMITYSYAYGGIEDLSPR